MVEDEPSIESVEREIAAHTPFAITGDDAGRVMHLFGMMSGIARRHRDELDRLRAVVTLDVSEEAMDDEAMVGDDGMSTLSAAQYDIEMTKTLRAERDRLWRIIVEVYRTLGTGDQAAMSDAELPAAVHLAIAQRQERAMDAEAERDRLRAVVEHAIGVLGTGPPSLAPGVLATVGLMRLALDPSEGVADE